MRSENDPIEIVVCYGTSCFARGNSENLAIVKNYVQSHLANASVRLSGKLCQNQCADGPNMVIGGELHHGVTSAKLLELLQGLSGTLGEQNGTA